MALAQEPERLVERRDLLRLATTGSVDDGKSTLIGRLLFDTREIFEDHLASVERASRQQGADYTNLALLTDGLRAEREQGITIDVAYRHFATPARRFILADTPGHLQYTRNMVTGASTADLTILLLDARCGLTDQTRRHLLVTALLDVASVVVCVNKLDLVDYSEAVFRSLQAELEPLARRLGVRELVTIPISALRGDNVVLRSSNTPWYRGPTLLEQLERVDVAATARARTRARLPIQTVIRPHRHEYHDYRAYAGPLVGGTLAVGDRVAVLPGGQTSRVAAIETFDGPLPRAVPPQSVAVRLEDELDVSRGDLLAAAGDPPQVGQDVEVTLCWFSSTPLRMGGRYLVKHTTRSTPALVCEVRSRVDVTTAAEDAGAGTLRANDIGRVRLRTLVPLVYDPYRRNRITGSLIVIDQATNETVAAGVLRG
jgi:bifunctional enzyme CysN/CysC